jgi:serine/threonine protein kinase
MVTGSGHRSYHWLRLRDPSAPVEAGSAAPDGRPVLARGVLAIGVMRNTHMLDTTTTDIGYGPGDLIAGKYRLGTSIREGGMCRVRMGVHTMLDLPVAIKFLRPSFRCPMLARSLQREARATAALRHPAIVRILDWGMLSSDDAYIVMEQLEGEELREYLAKQGPLPSEHAIRLLLPICGGVAGRTRAESCIEI